MAKSSQDSSSKRHFHWTNKVSSEDEEAPPSTFKSCSSTSEDEPKLKDNSHVPAAESRIRLSVTRKKLQAVAVSRWRSVLTTFAKNRTELQQSLGPRVVGTLFGYRRGHVHFVFQREPNSTPAFLIELATPITGLVQEMASGLVRLALECNKEANDEKKTRRLLEEPMWRTFCNGKKSGFASRKECGPKEWKVLKALEPISMGAGVLPADKEEGEGDGDEIMYMRAKFERVVGSRDSEAFYMMNPDSNGAPELSLYLLRV
ncbi:hypothetical protein DCAR_0313106 [Daucus carota subsp. sativus]|uniref:Uncharacterized protein n=1 Tax=Daucus carota subsp. sativus TaxID=79200 RepID=A0A166BTB7_DAUCS|nr:PREDICTED: protein MIZU-KUSSEI 1-like [Daucus carota subsp. sativus]WOG93819.1 hypothetical protein DCAR_0313106 [Daucus carota subsp. sativus]